MPTLPFDQGWSAIHSTKCGAVLGGDVAEHLETPAGATGPPHAGMHDDVVADVDELAEVGGRRSAVVAVVLEHGWEGLPVPALGNCTHAASSVPSAIFT